MTTPTRRNNGPYADRGDFRTEKELQEDFKRDMKTLRRLNKLKKKSVRRPDNSELGLMGELLDICSAVIDRSRMRHSGGRPLGTEEERLTRWTENACKGNAQTMEDQSQWLQQCPSPLSAIERVCDVLIDNLYKPSADAFGRPVELIESSAVSMIDQLSDAIDGPAARPLSKYVAACWLHVMATSGPLSGRLRRINKVTSDRAERRFKTAASRCKELADVDNLPGVLL
ncbi:hypothetical protein [Roseiconus lacunae]|uniref:Uncharacterized protein n=1 Tax=Roseiconus lacunae TaxID=2605694 RepID=A0ABT7PTH2_9BACT|nr:hypothetical protein [Roseiconus lacunae]MDM4019441.1 hypothetical protein [Roseiconus lacunae]